MDDTWETAEDLPPVCFACGNGLRWWWDGTGAARCAECDPPTTQLRRLGKTFLVRRTRGLPTDDVVEMARGLRSLMRAAGSDTDESYILEAGRR